MNAMRDLQKGDVLAHDHHFTQEVFNVLL